MKKVSYSTHHESAAGPMFVASVLFVALVAGSMLLLAEQERLPQRLSELSAWEAALLAFATFRLTRIIARESVGVWIRSLVPPDHPSPLVRTAAQLVRCPWCLGVWMAWLLTVAYLFAPAVATFPILIAAVAGMGIVIHTAAGALRALIPPDAPAHASPHEKTHHTCGV